MYSVDWLTRVITIPVGLMTLRDGANYTLSADSFWREIRRLEWNRSEGLWAEQILLHNNTRVIAGTTYVPENIIINGYTITMDPAAERVFLEGDNNNIIDVLNINGVSVIPSNSAGNTTTTVQTGSGLSAEQVAQLAETHAAVQLTEFIYKIHARKRHHDGATTRYFDIDGNAVDFEFDDDGQLINPRFTPAI